MNHGVIIHPGHGHGSPCGADIGDRLSSTIGYERRFNAFLQIEDEKSFTDFALSTAPPTPTYYPRMKKVNMQGPAIIGNLPVVRGLGIRICSIHHCGRRDRRDIRWRVCQRMAAPHVGSAFRCQRSRSGETPHLRHMSGPL